MINNVREHLDYLVPALLSRGVGWDIVYALKKTGFLITNENVREASQEQAIVYLNALNEYYSLEKAMTKTIH